MDLLHRVQTTSDFIQNLIFETLPFDYVLIGGSVKRPRPFYVHASLIKKWEKKMNEIFSKDNWEMYERILQVGDKYFDMYQIIISCGTEGQRHILDGLISSAQYSFPFEENPTIFIAAGSYNIMEEFIGEHQLEPFVLKTEETTGICTDDVTIKVVTFNKSVNEKLNLFQAYSSTFYRSFKNRSKYYYMTFSFWWERAPILRKGHINDDVCFVFPIILKHLGTIKYKNELNIMDLISLRLAICNVRDPFQANYIKSEIDFLVKRQLAKTVKNDQFHVDEYLVDNNCNEDPLLCCYLIYEFQDSFKVVNYSGLQRRLYGVVPAVGSIKLENESDVINKIKKSFNIHYDIDGIGFEQMSSSLFFDLIECRNVNSIELDTNYQWFKDTFKLIVPVTNNNHMSVTLSGANSFKFAEDCIMELKKYEIPKIKLIICCSLDDYRVLDNLAVRQINLNVIKIDSDMLKNLQQCVIKSPLRMFPCSIENSWQTWELLNNLEGLDTIHFCEDEGTWTSIFEFVIKELHRTNSNEFHFNIRHMRCDGIDFSLYKFTFDEQGSKLEIRNKESNEVIDLYEVKFYIEPDEKTNFEFYQ